MIGTAVFGLAACGIDMPKETNSSFETMTVKKQDVTMPIKYSARLKGQSDVTITPQVSGQLMQIAVSEGQQVKKGQVLFVIDSRNAQLELEAAQANLESALAAENSAKMEYESNKNLFEKKIVSRYMLDNSENSYKRAQAAVAQASASVNRAKVTLGFCTITSPVTGIIGEIPVRTGDQVSPASHLTIVSGNTNMDAEFSLSESILEEAIAEGFDGNANKAFKLFPDVTFNPEGSLYSGIQGTVVIPYARQGVIIVPQTAVVKLQDKQLVYKVKRDSTATATNVTIEDVGNGKDYIVVKGLKVGDKIVTIGANNVQEGQKVLFPKEEKSE